MNPYEEISDSESVDAVTDLVVRSMSVDAMVSPEEKNSIHGRFAEMLAFAKKRLGEELPRDRVGLLLGGWFQLTEMAKAVRKAAASE